MTLDDVDLVTDLDRRAFGDSGWSRRYFAGELTDSPISIFYVLTDGRDRILGYFGAWHIVDQLHLCTFAIDPRRHGHGLGALLLNCVLRLSQRLECTVVQLEVRESNQIARTLYQSRGFVEEAVRRNLYSDPKEDGVLMGRPTPERLNHAGWNRVGQDWPDGVVLRWDDRGGSLDEHWPAD